MEMNVLHILLATSVVLLWLVVVLGWLMTCRHGETNSTPTIVKVPPQPADVTAPMERKDNPAA
jgi:hypothetical protein